MDFKFEDFILRGSAVSAALVVLSLNTISVLL